jgi:hypothetical protein
LYAYPDGAGTLVVWSREPNLVGEWLRESLARSLEINDPGKYTKPADREGWSVLVDDEYPLRQPPQRITATMRVVNLLRERQEHGSGVPLSELIEMQLCTYRHIHEIISRLQARGLARVEYGEGRRATYFWIPEAERKGGNWKEVRDHRLKGWKDRAKRA